MTMSPADHLWFITGRYYNEVAMHDKRSLRDFVYIIPILVNSHIDWEIILQSASDYNLRPSLYYYLFFLNQLLSGRYIPIEVIDKLSPANGSRSRDWGWQLDKLFDRVECFSFGI